MTPTEKELARRLAEAQTQAPAWGRMEARLAGRATGLGPGTAGSERQIYYRIAAAVALLLLGGFWGWQLRQGQDETGSGQVALQPTRRPQTTRPGGAVPMPAMPASPTLPTVGNAQADPQNQVVAQALASAETAGRGGEAGTDRRAEIKNRAARQKHVANTDAAEREAPQSLAQVGKKTEKGLPGAASTQGVATSGQVVASARSFHQDLKVEQAVPALAAQPMADVGRPVQSQATEVAAAAEPAFTIEVRPNGGEMTAAPALAVSPKRPKGLARLLKLVSTPTTVDINGQTPGELLASVTRHIPRLREDN